MFNGIIYKRGKIIRFSKRKKGLDIFVKSNLILKKKDLGMSISCDGVCLTLVSFKKKVFEFYLSNETLKRSNFKKKIIGDYINLETPLKYGQNISGHICQGHVDTTAVLINIKKIDKSHILNFKINKKFKKDLIEKASILINGVSLTISEVTSKGFKIWVIPHTLKLTNLIKLKRNDLVNVEIDILSKYVKKYVKK
tara:strand:- start:250 stop:837 length:588 start_codon:yes stop_codon:yes gene_type:complete